MRRIYISGPMTGLPEFNFPAFQDAADKLRAAGFDVVSPHEIDPSLGGGWTAYMRADIALLVTCEAVVTLAGHSQSKGATLECYIATALEMEVAPLAFWLPLNENAATGDGALATQTKENLSTGPEDSTADSGGQ